MNEWKNEWSHRIRLPWILPSLWTSYQRSQKCPYCQVRLSWGFCFCVLSAEVSLTDARVLSYVIFMSTLRVRYFLSIFQIGKVKPREIKLHTRGDTASKSQSSALQPSWRVPQLWLRGCSTPYTPPSLEMTPGLSRVTSHRIGGSGCHQKSP